MLVTRLAAQVAANRMVGVGGKDFALSLLPAIAAGAAAAGLAGIARQALIAVDVQPLARLLIAGPLALAGSWVLIRSSGFGGPVRMIERSVMELWRAWRGTTAPSGHVSQ